MSSHSLGRWLNHRGGWFSAHLLPPPYSGETQRDSLEKLEISQNEKQWEQPDIYEEENIFCFLLFSFKVRSGRSRRQQETPLGKWEHRTRKEGMGWLVSSGGGRGGCHITLKKYYTYWPDHDGLVKSCQGFTRRSVGSIWLVLNQEVTRSDFHLERVFWLLFGM